MNKVVPAYALKDLVIYFLKLGTWGFGGPVALAGYMYRDLVERKSWISEEDYKEGLALAQLAPGPLAAQLGIYIGYIHYKIPGATLAGLAFVLPSFLMVLALGYVYTLWEGVPWMQAVFYGVGAAVIGIIAMSAFKLTRKSVGADKWRISIYVLSAAFTVVYETESVWLFLVAGAMYWLVKQAPGWWRGVAHRGCWRRCYRRWVAYLRPGKRCGSWPCTSRKRGHSFSAAGWRLCRFCMEAW